MGGYDDDSTGRGSRPRKSKKIRRPSDDRPRTDGQQAAGAYYATNSWSNYDIHDNVENHYVMSTQSSTNDPSSSVAQPTSNDYHTTAIRPSRPLYPQHEVENAQPNPADRFSSTLPIRERRESDSGAELAPDGTGPSQAQSAGPTWPSTHPVDKQGRKELGSGQSQQKSNNHGTGGYGMIPDSQHPNDGQQSNNKSHHDDWGDDDGHSSSGSKGKIGWLSNYGLQHNYARQDDEHSWPGSGSQVASEATGDGGYPNERQGEISSGETMPTPDTPKPQRNNSSYGFGSDEARGAVNDWPIQDTGRDGANAAEVMRVSIATPHRAEENRYGSSGQHVSEEQQTVDGSPESTAKPSNFSSRETIGTTRPVVNFGSGLDDNYQDTHAADAKDLVKKTYGAASAPDDTQVDRIRHAGGIRHASRIGAQSPTQSFYSTDTSIGFSESSVDGWQQRHDYNENAKEAATADSREVYEKHVGELLQKREATDGPAGEPTTDYSGVVNDLASRNERIRRDVEATGSRGGKDMYNWVYKAGAHFETPKVTSNENPDQRPDKDSNNGPDAGSSTPQIYSSDKVWGKSPSRAPDETRSKRPSVALDKARNKPPKKAASTTSHKDPNKGPKQPRNTK